ncbi:MAG: lysophospholipid acyltransferase family protein [Deltaproteobacteria bacterium]|nr:lysophospholipid acyltransferase family protein [Deltaproteobacteria bacterium]
MESPADNNHKIKKQWTSRSIGSSIQHRFFYTLIRIGGRRLAYFFLYFIVLYYIIFRPSIRRKSYFYLSHRFQDNSTLKRIIRSYLLSLELGKVLIDRAIVGILGYEKLSVSFKAKETLKELVSEGKGVIFLMAHVGCWQVALSAISFLNTRVNMVIRREEGDVDRHYFEHQGTKTPFSIIDPDGYLGGTLDMINVLKKGEVLCIMGDRVLGNPKNTIMVNFLGEEAPFPFSTFKVASVTGSPIVVLLTYKSGAARFGVDIASVIHVPGDLGRAGEGFRPYVNEFVNVLEKYTALHPFQFFNFYDMWEQP